MIDRSDSPATTQTNTGSFNIPSRLVSWLYGQLVRIANAVKRIVSRGNMGQSESLPETRPIVERTPSQVRAERTFVPTSNPQVTTPSQEQELHNPANRPLLELNGSEVLCSIRKVKLILGSMKAILEKLRVENANGSSKGEKRAEDIKKIGAEKYFDDIVFFQWEGVLEADQWPDPKNMTVDEKINFLLSCNNKLIEKQAGFVLMVGTFIQDIGQNKLPSVHRLITGLAEKYPGDCTDRASKDDIKTVQRKVVDIQVLLDEGFNETVRQKIAVDAKLAGIFSGIMKDLQSLTQKLQI